MSAPDSLIKTALTPDAPVVLDADYELDATDRRKIDKQIVGTQEAVVRNLRGQIGTWFTLSSSSPAVIAGDCLVPSANDGASDESNELAQIHYVTKATATTLAAAGIAVAVALTAANPSGQVRGAVAGIVGPSITGLAAGTAGPVRVNPTTGRAERVSSIDTGSYGLGFADSVGNLAISVGAGRDGVDGVDGTNGVDGGEGPAGPAGPAGTIASVGVESTTDFTVAMGETEACVLDAPANGYPAYLCLVSFAFVGTGNMRVKVYDEANLRMNNVVALTSFGQALTTGYVVASPGDAIHVTLTALSATISVTNVMVVLFPMIATL